MIGFDFWVQLFVLLACLFYAAPRGGMTLGLMGGIGLIIFIFGFGLKPGKPPVDVILTIMAVVCAGATLQAAGGLDCLLSIAEKILRNHPRFVCYLAPYLCWFSAVRVTLFTRCCPLFMTWPSRTTSVRNARWLLPRSPLRWA